MSDPIDPFDSLAALQQAHTALVAEIGKEVLAGENPARVARFVRRAVETGAILDDKEDRSAAQSLINFWTGRLSSVAREEEREAIKRALANESTLPPTVVPDLGDTLLKEFAPATLRNAIRAADAWLDGSTVEGRQIARRALLRLARLRPGVLQPDETTVSESEKMPFDAVPASRATLRDVGPSADQVDGVIAGLAEAGVIRVRPGETREADQIALRSSTLIDDWKTLREFLLARWAFRTKVEHWRPEGEASAGLESLGQGSKAIGLEGGAPGGTLAFACTGALVVTTPGGVLTPPGSVPTSIWLYAAIVAVGVGVYYFTLGGGVWESPVRWVRRHIRKVWDRDSALLKGEELEEVRSYLDRNDAERQFIEASRYREMMGHRRTRALAVGFATLGLVALIGWIVAIRNMREAKQLSDTNEKIGRRMQIQRDALVMQTIAESNSNQVISLLLMSEKQGLAHAAKKLLIIQTLGHVLFTPDSDEVSRTAEQWRHLEQELIKPDAPEGKWFKDNLQGTYAPDIARIISGRPPTRHSVVDLRRISSALRKYIVGRRESDAALENIRSFVFDQLIQVTERIVEATKSHPVQDIQAFRNLYWRLYTCEVVLLQDAPPDEGEKSENPLRLATEQFAEALWMWEESSDGWASPTVIADLKAALLNVKKVCGKP
jgi:hypothetical protein